MQEWCTMGEGALGRRLVGSDRDGYGFFDEGLLLNVTLIQYLAGGYRD